MSHLMKTGLIVKKMLSAEVNQLMMATENKILQTPQFYYIVCC